MNNMLESIDIFGVSGYIYIYVYIIRIFLMFLSNIKFKNNYNPSGELDIWLIMIYDRYL